MGQEGSQSTFTRRRNLIGIASLTCLLLVVFFRLEIQWKYLRWYEDAKDLETKSVETDSGSDSTLQQQVSGKIMFHCGRHVVDDPNPFLEAVFPDFVRHVDLRTISKPEDIPNPTAKDLVVYGKYGKCPMNPKWLDHNFPGKVVYIDTEAQVFDGRDRDMRGVRSYELGARADSPRSLRVYFATLSLAIRTEQYMDWLFDPLQRRGNTEEFFLIYAHSNCVPFREVAFDSLSELLSVNAGPVHYDGACHGKNNSKAQPAPKILDDRDNVQLFHRYQFCLVMENQAQEGYVSEKIVHAFLGGCIPIYYGSTEVYNVFNPDSFVFYNISDPQPSIHRVSYLLKNKNAYHHVLSQPLLSNGNQTIEDYFSYRDDLGKGKLKRRIRDMLDLP